GWPSRSVVSYRNRLLTPRVVPSGISKAALPLDFSRGRAARHRGPAVRQPSASTPPLRWNRMVMLLIDRLAQRTLMAVILTPGRDASIPLLPRSRARGPAPPHRSRWWREARDHPPLPVWRAWPACRPRSAGPAAYHSRSPPPVYRDPHRARAAGR